MSTIIENIEDSGTPEFEHEQLANDLAATAISKAVSAASTGVQLQPSIVVGLGGTGIQCVRRAKPIIAARAKGIQTTGYVYIDADQRSFLEEPGLASIESSEQCFIGGYQLQPLLDHPESHDWLLKQIPGKLAPTFYEKAAKGEGCGQIRAVGRVALLASLLNVKTVGESALAKVQRLSAQLITKLKSGNQSAQTASDPVIYIVCSLAGAVGSGGFIDTALMFRTITQFRGTIVGIFVLPEAFDEKAQGDQTQLQMMRANTYAALKELQALQDLHDGLRLEVVVNSNGDKLELPAGRQLFDLSYLIDYKNESSKKFGKTEDVYELVARLLLHENASQFGANAHSIQRNLNTLRGVARDPETQLPRLFSSFANTRLAFPVERITKFCAWSTLQELIETELLKSPLGANRRLEEVQAFLGARELDEAGSVDQIQNRLLRDPRNAAPITASEGMGRNFGRDKSPADFTMVLRQKMDTFRQRILPDAEAAINQNLGFYLGEGIVPGRPIGKWLDAFVEEMLRKHGARGAAGAFDELTARATSLRREMLSENDAWTKRDRKAQAGILDTALTELAGMSRARAAVSSRDDKLKIQAVGAFQVVVGEDLRTLARTAAVKIYDDLISLARNRKQDVEGFAVACDGLSGTLRDRLHGLRVEGRRDAPNFIVDMDVTERGFLERFYADHRVPAAELLNATDGYYLRLISLKRDGLIREFAGKAAGLYSEKINSLDVVAYITSNAGTHTGLTVKLDELFEMCLPFWRTRLPQVNMQYDQHVDLGCVPLAKGPGDSPTFSEDVHKWVQLHTTATRGVVSAAPNIVAVYTPYEIEVVRYVHGARACYISDAADWKQKYEQVVAMKAFPVHIHRGFADLPDLFPDRTKTAKQMFALGMAFGFIAKRGEYYYMNVACGADMSLASPNVEFEVPMHTEWQTIFGSPDDRKVPMDTGSIAFSFKKRRAKESMLLAQGRIHAVASLSQDEKKVNLILAGIDEYVKAVGSATTKTQLTAYVQVLDDFEAEKLREQIEQEHLLVREFIRSLE